MQSTYCIKIVVNALRQATTTSVYVVSYSVISPPTVFDTKRVRSL